MKSGSGVIRSILKHAMHSSSSRVRQVFHSLSCNQRRMGYRSMVTITILSKIAMSQFFRRLIMSFNLLVFKEVDSQEQPAQGVLNGVILGGKVWGGHTHVMIEVVVRQQIIQMPGDLLRIAYPYRLPLPGIRSYPPESGEECRRLYRRLPVSLS